MKENTRKEAKDNPPESYKSSKFSKLLIINDYYKHHCFHVRI